MNIYREVRIHHPYITLGAPDVADTKGDFTRIAFSHLDAKVSLWHQLVGFSLKTALSLYQTSWVLNYKESRSKVGEGAHGNLQLGQAVGLWLGL